MSKKASNINKVPCPSCGKKVKWEGNTFRPFCSKRCRILDLGDWAMEKHRIPGEKVSQDNLEVEKSKHGKDKKGE